MKKVSFSKTIPEIIETAEKQTCAEFVIQKVKTASKYETTMYQYLIGTFLFWALPFSLLKNEMNDIFFMGMLAHIFLGLFLFKNKTVKNWLIPKSIKKQKLEMLAKTNFFDFGIGNTKAKTGILIVCAEKEKLIFVLPDTGILKKISWPFWKKLADEFSKKYAKTKQFEKTMEDLLSAMIEPLKKSGFHPDKNDTNELSDNLVTKKSKK